MLLDEVGLHGRLVRLELRERVRDVAAFLERLHRRAHVRHQLEDRVVVSLELLGENDALFEHGSEELVLVRVVRVDEALVAGPVRLQGRHLPGLQGRVHRLQASDKLDHLHAYRVVNAVPPVGGGGVGPRGLMVVRGAGLSVGGDGVEGEHVGRRDVGARAWCVRGARPTNGPSATLAKRHSITHRHNVMKTKICPP